jgi:hypothetical protein
MVVRCQGFRIVKTIGLLLRVRLSALRAGRALTLEISSGTHFCLRLSKLQSYSAVGRMRAKISMTS